MLDSDRFLNVALLVASLIGVAVTWTLVFRRALLENFRQEVFGLRRELFMMMANGEIAANDPLYASLRSTMNGMLRFAEQLSFVRLMIVGSMNRDLGKAYERRVAELLASVESESARERLRDIRERLGLEVVKYVVYTSPALWLVTGVMLAFVVVTERVRAVRRIALATPVIRFEAEAECEGAMLEAA